VQSKDLKRLTEIQNTFAKKISLQNNFSLEEIDLVAGIDIAYWQEGLRDYGVCCIQVFDYKTKKVIEEVEYAGPVEFPYIAGYLAFRELPLVLKAAEKLSNKPDLFMFDGNGYLHKRHMGLATQASFELGKPTIGVAKNYFKINDVNFIMPKNKDGAYTDIVVNGKVMGRALRTRKDVKPVFVSCGNWIDLDTATYITMHFVEKDSRLPITTRYADIATHRARELFRNKYKNRHED